MSGKAPLPSLPCPICDEPMPAAVRPWTFFCDRCDYWASDLQPVTNILAKDDFLANAEQDDVLNPIHYLDDLRIANFRSILRHMAAWMPTNSGTILEVGCGPGLFLTEAKSLGLNAVGIEPFEAMARRGRKNGLDIRLGLFPDCLEDHELFEAIVFNDVFEHLPNAAEVIRTCIRHLVPGGLVVLNLPNSHGLFFRVALLAAKMGYESPWSRMWQKTFYTPHLHYWSAKSLNKLCTMVGLEEVAAPVDLASISRKGLWRRIRASPNMTLTNAVVSLVGATCCSMAVPFLPSDCYLQLFRKPR